MSGAVTIGDAAWRALADSLPSLVWRAGPDGEIEHANVHCAHAAGIAESGVERPPWHAILEGDVERVVAEWRAARAASAPFEAEVSIRSTDGAPPRAHRLSMRPVRDAYGAVVEWLGTATPAPVAEPAPPKTDGVIDDAFLATLSHELRTPLNAILGWAHLLERGELTPDAAARAVSTIVRNAQTQARLVDDLLDLSRIRTDKLHLAPSRIAIGRALEGALDGVRPLAGAKGVRLSSDLAPALGYVRADPHRLEQILWNVLTNAIKFTPAGGSVSLSARDTGGRVSIAVADTGRGISSELLPFVFERFTQGDASTTRSEGGLGLGLWIVRRLVTLHGGDVRASSEGIDRGATFTIELPAEPPIATDADIPATAGAGGRLAGARVLVVDDDPDARDVAAAVLEHEGATVCVAASADEALSRVERDRPDVIVCDVAMPGRDGLSFMRELRASGEGAGGFVPAVALTGYASERDKREALLAGFQAHAAKPIDPNLVIETIRRLWRRGRRDRA